MEQVALSTGTIQYLVSDSLGSVRGVVDSSGALSASTAYDAWGNPETAGGLSAYTPFGYAGSYVDATGLSYLINRYYDSQTGQFLSVDPLVDSTSSAYLYAADDPVRLADPKGLCAGPLVNSGGLGTPSTASNFNVQARTPPSIGLNWLEVQGGYDDVSGWASGTASFKKPQQARILIELLRGWYMVDWTAGPVTTSGSVVPFLFGDLSQGRYTVVATFQQGNNIQSDKKDVEVGEP